MRLKTCDFVILSNSVFPPKGIVCPHSCIVLHIMYVCYKDQTKRVNTIVKLYSNVSVKSLHISMQYISTDSFCL